MAYSELAVGDTSPPEAAQTAGAQPLQDLQPRPPPPDPARPRPRRHGARACVICNKRKIRCNLSQPGVERCSNCQAFDYDCVPHQRKRKRYSIVSVEGASPRAISTNKPPLTEVLSGSGDHECPPVPPQTSVPVNSRPGTRQEGQTPQETAEFVQTALTAQFGHGYPQMTTPVLSVTASTCKNPGSSPGNDGAYLGRSKYLGDELEEHEGSNASQDKTDPHLFLTNDDWEVLKIRKAFHLPSRAVCGSLASTFVTKCDPLMPVVDPKVLTDLEVGRMSEKPFLLLQAIFMAGSRMQTQCSPLDDFSTQDLYNRAKVLFFSGYEKDPMILVTAVIILQYWNPCGPSHISIHNSSYWLRIGVGLVHQMGLHKEPDPQRPDAALRRKAFWTLFARDSLLSAGQGRPRAIHLEDCSIRWPDVSDFQVADKRAHLFVAYVKIAGLLGDLTQWHLRGCPRGQVRFRQFEKSLQTWIDNLPPELRIVGNDDEILPYDCEVRFLYLPYLVIICLLYKPKLPSKSTAGSRATAMSTIASSCIAHIFEDSLARHDVRNAVAMQAIYLLIAGICQLSNYSYPLLWQHASKELDTILLSLSELSKTWMTAKDTLCLLQKLRQGVFESSQAVNSIPMDTTGLDWNLFKPFGSLFSTKMEVVRNNLDLNPTFRDACIPMCTTEGPPTTDQNEFWIGENNPNSAETALPAISTPEGLITDLFGVPGSDTLQSGESWFLQAFY